MSPADPESRTTPPGDASGTPAPPSGERVAPPADAAPAVSAHAGPASTGPASFAAAQDPARARRLLSPERVGAAGVYLATGIVLVIAAWLSPAAEGVGTHERLGLPPCGFLQVTGMPCLSCGMTTSFSHAAHGDLLAAGATQLAGATLALLTAIVHLVAGWAVLAGMSLSPLFQLLTSKWVLISLGIWVGLAWVIKVVLVAQGGSA